MTSLTVEQQRELAAEVFPDQWSRALSRSGRAGQKWRASLRKQAVEKVAVDALRAQGRSCATCRNFTQSMGRDICLADSDFYGDALIKPTDLCSRWRKT